MVVAGNFSYRDILRLYRVIQGTCKDSGKENGSYYLGFGTFLRP